VVPYGRVGAGAVGRLAARAIVAERPIEKLTIWNRTPERAAALAHELGGMVATHVAEALEPAVRRHRIVVTATASTAPLIKAAWVAKGTHVTSAGTGSPEKVELEPELLAKADKVIADRRAMGEGELPLDWGMGESLAYASLLDEGHGVRLSGEDVGRGRGRGGPQDEAKGGSGDTCRCRMLAQIDHFQASPMRGAAPRPAPLAPLKP